MTDGLKVSKQQFMERMQDVIEVDFEEGLEQAFKDLEKAVQRIVSEVILEIKKPQGVV